MARAASGEANRLWCRRPVHLSVRGPDGSQREFSLRKPFALIGGDPRADVVLNEGSPPPCGLYLHATNDGIFCVGLSPSAPHGWLRPKKYVRFAQYEIAAQFDDDGPPQVTSTVDPRAKNSVTGLAPLLEFRSASGKALERTVSRQLTVIGREPPSTLRLKHDSISRAHLVLYWDGETLWFVDLLSRNGAHLAGQPREAGKLLPGETLHLGRVRVRQIGVAEPADTEPSPPNALAKTALAADRAARESAGAIRERVLRDQVATMQDTIERLRRELQEHQRLAAAEQERLRQESMAQQTQFDQRLTDIEAPLAAEIAALRQDLDRRQAELDRSRKQADEQTEQIRELEARREPVPQSRLSLRESGEQSLELEARQEPEVARLRQELQEHQRLAAAERERLRQESMARQPQFDQRPNEIEAPLAAELAALRQELDRRQAELDRSRKQAEEQAEQIRELEARREPVPQSRLSLRESGEQSLELEVRQEPEVALLRQELQEQLNLAAAERERLRQESMARQPQFDQRPNGIEAPLAAELAALRQELDRRQAELDRSRKQAEEQAEQIRELEARREPVPQSRLSLRESGEQSLELEVRQELDRCQAELDRSRSRAEEQVEELRQELGQRQDELDRSRSQAEEQAEELRQEIDRRDSELLAERERAVQLAARLDEIETRRAADVALDEISDPEPQQPPVGGVVSGGVVSGGAVGGVVGGGETPHPSPLTPHPSALPPAAGRWDDNVLNRLLEFKAKQDGATSRRRWFVAAGVAGLVLAVVAGVLVLAKVWLAPGPD